MFRIDPIATVEALKIYMAKFIKKMEEMVNNTLANVYDAEISMEHAESAAHRGKIKEKNAQRLESVEDTRREIEEERSYL